MPDTVIVKVKPPVGSIAVRGKPPVRVVKVNGGMPGRKGDTGNPGIYVGPTPPPDPQENDLWLDTSA